MHVQYGLREILTAFFRQKDKFFTVFLLILLSGLIFFRTHPPVYIARGSLLVKLGQDTPLRPHASDTKPEEYSSDESEVVVQSDINILKSTDLIASAVKDTGAENLYPGISKTLKADDQADYVAAGRLATKDMEVTADPKSEVIEIRVTSTNPQMAQKFTQHLVARFIDKYKQIFNNPQLEFLQQQALASEKKMSESQKAFQDFKQSIGVSGLTEEITQLQTEKSSLANQAFLGINEAQAALSTLEGKAAEFRATYQPDSPILQRMNDSIAVARAEVAQRQSDLSNAGGGGALSSKNNKIDERIAYLENNRPRYEALAQQVQTDQEDYKYYLQASTEAKTSDMMNSQNISRVQILDNPVVPAAPESMRRSLLLAGLLMTALLLGCGAVVMGEAFDDTIIYPEQITAVAELPVLATF
jgi:uncharacterized protein involved in exopolysaccharide biosynthesis